MQPAPPSWLWLLHRCVAVTLRCRHRVLRHLTRPGPCAPPPQRSAPVWAVIVAHFCFNWGYYTLLAWLPSYFEMALGELGRGSC